MISKRIFSIASVAVVSLYSGAFGQLDLLPSIPKGTVAVQLKPLANISSGAYGISAPGDPNRLFVVEQKGQILIMEQNGTVLPTPALDIGSRVAPPLVTTSVNDERGLLGLAFHPDYANPGTVGFRKVYTFGSELVPGGGAPTYATPNGAPTNFQMVINEWTRDANNPNLIDPTSRREVFSYGKNAGNHNGGTIAFGPDGYLYLGTGDGGNSYDAGANGNPTNNSHAIVNGNFATQGNSLNLTNPMGKMLRIDPIAPALKPTSTDAISANGQYRIPTNMPVQVAGQLGEIYAYGLRNPYRFAFDDRPGGNGQLIAADVGQGNIEEIDRITLGGNYGWVQKEGTFLVNRVFNADGTLAPGGGSVNPISSPELPGSLIIDPISGVDGTLQYDHQDGLSITGGFVYRGSFLPELEGKYIFADLSLRNLPGLGRIDGRLFYADLTTGKLEEFLLPQYASGFIEGQTVHGFGQDGNGELYVFATNANAASGGTGGVIYSLTSVPEPSAFLLLGVSMSLASCVRRRRTI
jgi:glucose/arabinose dehydrogenase